MANDSFEQLAHFGGQLLFHFLAPLAFDIAHLPIGVAPLILMEAMEGRTTNGYGCTYSGFGDDMGQAAFPPRDSEVANGEIHIRTAPTARGSWGFGREG